MDNDIIERAKEYADRLKSAKIGDFGIATVYGYKDVYNANMTAYERGAKEQKAIDEVNYKQGYHDAVEKACEWIKENFEYYVDVEVSSYYMYGDRFVEDFRKAMED